MEQGDEYWYSGNHHAIVFKDVLVLNHILNAFYVRTVRFQITCENTFNKA